MHRLAKALKLPPEVIKRVQIFEDTVLAPLVVRNDLPITVAEQLLRVTDVQQRAALANQAVEEQWSGREARAAVRQAVASRRRLDSNVGTIQKRVRRVARLSRELDRLLEECSLTDLPIGVRRDLVALHGRLALLISSEISPTLPGAQPASIAAAGRSL